jgi:hypothetical protein
MRPLFAVTKLVLLALAAAMIAAGPARASFNDPLTMSDRTLLTLQGRTIELQALERRDSRRAFQQQQQQYRDEDRRMNQAPSPRQELPQIRSNCKLRIFGNRWLDKCR